MAAIRAPVSDDRFDGVQDALKQIVLDSARVKAEVVTLDEREGGLRNILNYGHSIGHAYEGILAPQILHGECVSIGMNLEAQLGRYLGTLRSSAASRLTKCLASYGLPLSHKDPVVQRRSGGKLCRVEDLMTLLAVDKKNAGKQKRVTLLSSIGRTHEKKATAVSDSAIRVALCSAVQVQPYHSSVQERICIPPGSKSISNRALVLAALGEGTVRIKNLLHSDDTEVMLQALTELKCASFEWEEDGEILVVKGNGGKMEPSVKELYLGNAGTASRFLTTVATLVPTTGELRHSVVTGNNRMKQRPIGPLVDALCYNGAKIEYLEKEGSLPLHIGASGGFLGGDVELTATLSSQYVSSILMCAPYAKKPVTLRLRGGKPISQLYIDMTAAMMGSFGVQVTKSTTEPHTYHIEQGRYQNPPEYVIESDASSATYPLAIAAITGTTCTVPNIGSSSLQGDARFAVDVLRPMGCSVTQTQGSTTVTGPSVGLLKPIPEVDMEPMTDAFLTASMLAAVARSSDNQKTTRIVGIANQRVKECDRIRAIHDQLAKFGVTSREYEDGIEIDGSEIAALREPPDGVDCYDDHRVAMSFSVLALAAQQQTLIRERECVGKTWPGWWDELHQNFSVGLEGVDLTDETPEMAAASQQINKSLFVIGMRGAGKSTAGTWAASILGWTFIDLDQQMEHELGCSIPTLIERDGWDGFRSCELSLLQRMMKEKPTNHVFACGGGVVETETARVLLTDYHKSGGLVLFIHRDLQTILQYLSQDKTRPAYTEDIQGVWERRKPHYSECSNYEYFSPNPSPESMVAASKDFTHLLLTMTGQNPAFEQILAKEQSFFVSLAAPDVTAIIEDLPEVVVGSDAVELRVDLLRDYSPEFVGQQLSMIRRAVDVPIVFTIRSRPQGGEFPDEPRLSLALYGIALKMGVEFIDMELSCSAEVQAYITKFKGQTQIIASHHDPRGTLRWSDGSWMPYYNQALQHGDLIKLIGVAATQQDNEDVHEFRKRAAHARKPLIALNMGAAGQLSRIQNRFMTPVTHPLLSNAAAPGQLSAASIRRALSLHGVIEPRTYYLFGSPISASRSPALHNSLFRTTGLPHTYAPFETAEADALAPLLASPEFGGASVTIPLKLEILRHLDDLSPDAHAIGAVNTVVVDPSQPSATGVGHFRTGHNTDWRGMVHVLEAAGAGTPLAAGAATAGLVIGGGGTARAAVHALHRMGASPIYVVGRTPAKIRAVVDELAAARPPGAPAPDVRPLLSRAAARAAVAARPPRLAVGTVPADRAIDPDVQEVLGEVLRSMFAQRAAAQGASRGPPGVLLDMAYDPPVTPLMGLAQQAGWRTVGGLEALAAQGMFQFELWTGIKPAWKDVRATVMGAEV